eukprot:gene16949-12130_t
MSATDADAAAAAAAAAATASTGPFLLDELTPKQRLKEFKSVQKALHSKDAAARLAVLPKLTTDARYFTEGQCLPAFLESLAPNKKLLEYLVPALSWFGDHLATVAHVAVSDHVLLQLLLRTAAEHATGAATTTAAAGPSAPSSPVKPTTTAAAATDEAPAAAAVAEADASAAATATAPSPFALPCLEGLLLTAAFREELKKPKAPKPSKKRDATTPPPPPPPVEAPVYATLRTLALRCLFLLLSPLFTCATTATETFTAQGQEQRQRFYGLDPATATATAADATVATAAEGGDAAAAAVTRAQRCLARAIPQLLPRLHVLAFAHYRDYLAAKGAAANATANGAANEAAAAAGAAYERAWYAWHLVAFAVRHVDHRAAFTDADRRALTPTSPYKGDNDTDATATAAVEAATPAEGVSRHTGDTPSPSPSSSPKATLLWHVVASPPRPSPALVASRAPSFYVSPTQQRRLLATLLRDTDGDGDGTLANAALAYLVACVESLLFATLLTRYAALGRRFRRRYDVDYAATRATVLAADAAAVADTAAAAGAGGAAGAAG